MTDAQTEVAEALALEAVFQRFERAFADSGTARHLLFTRATQDKMRQAAADLLSSYVAQKGSQS